MHIVLPIYNIKFAIEKTTTIILIWYLPTDNN